MERGSGKLAGEDAETFEAARPRLLGLAYRILGSLADAEDAVQDTFVKWAKADRGSIGNKAAWLTTACTRRCLDLLKAAHRSRVNYVGSWLPEPVHTQVQAGPPNEVESRLELADTLSTAFLLMLERLTPKERAAYLLHDIFDRPYREIAETLSLQESACRKLVSRAKAHVEQAKVRHRTPPARQQELLSAFEAAVTGGSTGALAALLSDEIRLSADGGGKVAALPKPLQGRERVMAFVTERLPKYWAGYRWQVVELNGAAGVMIRAPGSNDDEPAHAAVSFAYDAVGRAADIYIMRNPEKLAALDRATVS